jgi:6-phosphogluconolactonase
MIEAEWWEYDDLDEMAEAVAGDVGFIVESALDARGNCLLALPGGGTPQPIFARLAAAKLNWKKVTIIPTDDRLVAMDNELSNVRAIGQAFLRAGARVVPIATEIPDHKLAGNSADARLQDLPWPPDLCWLGMGEDGHTASLFPSTAALDAGRAWVAPNWVEKLGAWRVTLTAPAINAARHVIFLVNGAAKAAPLREVLQGERDPERLPSQLIQPADGTLEWLVDEAAAAKLE